MTEHIIAQPMDRKEAERNRLLELRSRQPHSDNSTGSGVLLSDVIKEYAAWFDLISPFDETNLKPACYKLTIGDEYAIDGKIQSLPDQSGENAIRIPSFAVAVIKTRETINMPPFLIGRWNIQVPRAYQGLLWVGGPQVDAGYVGHLFCPVYNLSDKDVVLFRGEVIAVIDFEKTTNFREGKSKPYPLLPDKILFEDYHPQDLVSGLVTHAKSKIDYFEQAIKTVQARVDNFVSLTLGVMAVLFAALAIFVTRPESSSFWNPGVFLISGLAIYLSMFAWLKSKPDGQDFGRAIQAIVIGLLLLGLGLQFHSQRAEMQKLKRQIQELNSPASTEPLQ